MYIYMYTYMYIYIYIYMHISALSQWNNAIPPTCTHTHTHTHMCVWHDSFMFVTRLIHMCGMTHSCVWHDACIHDRPEVGCWVLRTTHLRESDTSPCRCRVTWALCVCVSPRIWELRIERGDGNIYTYEIEVGGQRSEKVSWVLSDWVSTTRERKKWMGDPSVCVCVCVCRVCERERVGREGGTWDTRNKWEIRVDAVWRELWVYVYQKCA